MTTPSEHLSQETLDLLHLTALDAQAAQAARAHLGVCAVCAARWSALRADAEHFERFVLPRTLPRVQARARGRAEGWRWRWPARFVLPPLAAVGLAGVAAVLLLAPPGSPPPDADPAYVGVKGARPGLTVLAQRAGGGEAFRLAPEARLQPGDRLRFVVRPATAGFVMVASLDGAGTFSVYAPATALPAPSDGGLLVELPGSVELDDALGREVLAAFFSSRPLAADEVERALRSDPGAPRLDGATALTLAFTKARP